MQTAEEYLETVSTKWGSGRSLVEKNSSWLQAGQVLVETERLTDAQVGVIRLGRCKGCGTLWKPRSWLWTGQSITLGIATAFLT